MVIPEEAGPDPGPGPEGAWDQSLAETQSLHSLIEPVVTAMGFELVRVGMFGSGDDRSLQIMAEDPATGQLTLDQCAEISRALSDVFDAADPIEGAYRLEVSSPGIDRPLTRAKDWANWIGHEAKMSLVAGGEGQKRFTGIVRGVEGDSAKLEVKGEERLFPLAQIESAKLMLTDALIAASRPLSTEGAEDFEEEDQ